MSYASEFLVFCLMTIAALVAYRLYKFKNIWTLVVAYWIVLTVKNALDFIGGIVNAF